MFLKAGNSLKNEDDLDVGSMANIELRFISLDTI